MNIRPILLTVGSVAFASTLAAATVPLDSYETHGWINWFTSGVPAPVIVGRNSAHISSGAAAMQVTYTAQGTNTFAGISSRELLTESGSGMNTGWSLDIYCEAAAGATGQIAAKMELVGDGGSNSSGVDTALTLNGWTTIVLPAANMAGNYKNVGVVLVTGSGSGDFYLWLDNLQRDGVLWEDFETYQADKSTDVFPSNIDPPFRGEACFGGVTIGAPTPTAGNHCFGMTWTSDSDGKVEVGHSYASGVDMSTTNVVSVNVYVPTGTNLPTVSCYLVDDLGAGSFLTGSAVPVHDSWQNVSIRIDGVHTAPGFHDYDVRQIKIVCENAGSAGTLYFDAAATDVPVRLSGLSVE